MASLKVLAKILKQVQPIGVSRPQDDWLLDKKRGVSISPLIWSFKHRQCSAQHFRPMCAPSRRACVWGGGGGLTPALAYKGPPAAPCFCLAPIRSFVLCWLLSDETQLPSVAEDVFCVFSVSFGFASVYERTDETMLELHGSIVGPTDDLRSVLCSFDVTLPIFWLSCSPFSVSAPKAVYKTGWKLPSSRNLYPHLYFLYFITYLHNNIWLHVSKSSAPPQIKYIHIEFWLKYWRFIRVFTLNQPQQFKIFKYLILSSGC